MDSVKALARSVSLAGLHPATRLATSSSRARHCYGQPDVAWENSRWPERQYLERHERWRVLENTTRQVPGLLKVDLTAERLFQILTILTSTFTPDATPINDLAGLSRLRFDARAMLQLKLFAEMPELRIDRPIPIADLDALAALAPGRVLFAADVFQSLAADFHQLLGTSPELMFTPSPANPFRVRIQLTAPANNPLMLAEGSDRVVAFYEQLAANRLPGIFDVTGALNLKAAFLGYFDTEARTKGTTVFPQHHEPVTVRTAIKTKLIARSMGDSHSNISLQSTAPFPPLIENLFRRIDLSGRTVWDGQINLSRDGAGPVRMELQWFQEAGLDYGRKTVSVSSAEAPELAEIFRQAAAAAFGTEFELDLTPLEPFSRPAIEPRRSPPPSKEVIARERAKVLKTAAGQPDTAAIDNYEWIIFKFEHMAGINLKTFDQKYRQIKDQLDDESKRFVAASFYYYLCRALSGGNIGNLEGMPDIFSLLENPIFLQPEQAEWARFFLENLTPEEIGHFASSLDTTHDFTVNLLEEPIKGLADDLAAHSVLQVAGRSGIPPKYRELLALRRDSTITPNQQVLLKQYAIELMQSFLPNITVDETVLEEFYGLKELLYIMCGKNPQIRAFEPELVAGIARVLELSVGQELPLLRRALPAGGLELLQQALAADPDPQHHFDPTRGLTEVKPS